MEEKKERTGGRAEAHTTKNAPPFPAYDAFVSALLCSEAERVRAIRQSVLADVSCVLARASGADIDPKRAYGAASNVCEILFSQPLRSLDAIPKLFWETPLGRAVGVCCGGELGELGEPFVCPPAPQ